MLNVQRLAHQTQKITSIGCLKCQKNLTNRSVQQQMIYIFFSLFLLNVLSLLIINYSLSSLTHHSMSLLFFSSLSLSTESLGIALSTNFLSQIPSLKLYCFIDIFALSLLCPHLKIEGFLFGSSPTKAGQGFDLGILAFRVSYKVLLILSRLGVMVGCGWWLLG